MHGTPDQDVALEVRDVTAGYERGRPVLTSFSVKFPKRSLVLVRGRNGSGKSTLLELCSGYLKPWQGAVRISGADAGSPTARDLRRVCRTEPALYPNMTVRDHIVFASRCVGADSGQGLSRVGAYGLEPWLEYDPKSLSTGNRRKLWITMCTLGEFDVAILDEPFNGLDREGTERLCIELREWSRSKLVVLISHAPAAGVEADVTLTMGGSTGE